MVTGIRNSENFNRKSFFAIVTQTFDTGDFTIFRLVIWLVIKCRSRIGSLDWINKALTISNNSFYYYYYIPTFSDTMFSMKYYSNTEILFFYSIKYGLKIKHVLSQ